MNLPKTIAVVGVSEDKTKFGRRVFDKLVALGFEVYPINPKHSHIDGFKCYPSLSALPKKPDLVLTVVPPTVTEKVVQECKQLGISSVWMQPGSESEQAIKFCKENGISVTHSACFVVDGLKEKL